MRRALLAVCAACILVPIPASAEPEPAQQDWSIGAGLGLVSYSFFGSYGRGMISDYVVGGAPSASELGGPVGLTVSVERRLGEASWLSLGVLGSHVSREASRPLRDESTQAFRDLSSDVQETAVGAILGLRYVFNPLAVVEVGAFGNVAAGRHTLGGSETTVPWQSSGASKPTETLEYDGSGLWLSAGFGLTFEKSLTRQLGLRFSLGVLSVSRTSTQTTATKDGVPSAEQTVAKWDGGLDLSPTLELRVSL